MTTWNKLRKEILSDKDVKKAYDKLPSVGVAAQIINARKTSGLTQNELAKKAKTSQSAIARLESGDYTGYSMKTLLKVAQALNSMLEIKIQPRFQ